MKKQLALFFALLIFSFSFIACGDGNPSMDSIKQSYKNEGYTIETSTNDELNKIAGVIEGFTAHKGSTVQANSLWLIAYIYKFDKKNLAEEYINKAESYYIISLKGEIYLCLVTGSQIDETGNGQYGNVPTAMQVTLDIFNSCF